MTILNISLTVVFVIILLIVVLAVAACMRASQFGRERGEDE